MKQDNTMERVNNLAQMLSRSTKQIKEDRATEIAEMAEVELKRMVEDLQRDINRLERRKRNALDLSPDNTYSLITLNDFEPLDFVEKYAKIGLEIREKRIILENAKTTYNELFGETYQTESII